MQDITLPAAENNINGCYCNPSNIKTICDTALGNMQREAKIALISMGLYFLFGIIMVIFYAIGRYKHNETCAKIASWLANKMSLITFLYMGSSLILCLYVLA